MAGKKEPFGGKQAPAFGQGKEKKEAAPRKADKGRERQESNDKAKKRGK
jgi:hypothetical protein